VLLLGGPNTYLPFLQQCWRLRIPETWDERGYPYPKDVPIEELIFVPRTPVLRGVRRGAVRLHEPPTWALPRRSSAEGVHHHGRKAQAR
jgi:hypothetical protein